MTLKTLVISISLFLAAFAYGAQYSNVPGTLALWHMDEGSGSTITDATGNGHNGTLVGTTYKPNWDGGRYGGSGIHLNVDLPAQPSSVQSEGAGIALPLSSASLTNRDNFTFQFNFKWDGNTGFYRSGDNFAGYLYYDFDSFGVRFHSNDPANAYFRAMHRFSSGWQEVLYVFPGIQEDVWYDIAATRQKLLDGTTDIKLFVDGVEVNSENITGTWTSGSKPGFGYIEKSGAYTIGASIDEARVLEYAIPEPATMSLLALGGLALLRRTKK